MNEQDKNSEDSNKLTSFLSLAFCIDGECVVYKELPIEVDGEIITSVMFKLTDSKRGIFYVTLSYKNN